MFTGLIQGIGKVTDLRSRGEAAAVTIQADCWSDELVDGESVAVNGACLTVASHDASSFTCDVLTETLSRTNLKTSGSGASVNLERALRPTDRIGGHMVTGHIDGPGTVVSVRKSGPDTVLRIECSDDLLQLIVAKGSVAVSGISLTVASVDRSGFELHIIPETMARTTAGGLSSGSGVNLETDLIGKYVQKFLGHGEKGPGLSLKNIRDAGYDV